MVVATSTSVIDPNEPFELAEGIWWVGCYQEDDSFQAHAYLIVHGDQSVLIDPGGRRTFAETKRKIETLIAFDQIRYFICQHQDPDITASLPTIDDLVSRPDALVVTHWRAQMLMKEYGLRLPFLCVEKSGWTLDLGGRELNFVFTPYAHFPGAFCTFDKQTGVLFSSDLFGGFSEGFTLFAKDESYFEAMRPFHEHYIASNEVLVHAVGKIRKLPLTLIAPQHGSIIPGALAPYLLERLTTLDCGLFLLAQGSADVHRLTILSKTLRDFTKAMILYRDFRDIIDASVPLIQRLLPVESLAFYCIDEDGKTVMLTPGTRYRGQPAELPAALADFGELGAANGVQRPPTIMELTEDGGDLAGPVLVMPLADPGADRTNAIALFRLSHPVEIDDEAHSMLVRLAQPLNVAVEREMMLRNLDQQRERLYQRSIRDPLTGLFNRAYMQDVMQRLLGLHDRDPKSPVSVAVMDIDHFKSVNDTYGHNQGDLVLKEVSKAIGRIIRDHDLPVRLGGEEFAVFVTGESAENVAGLAERLRAGIAALNFRTSMGERQITASIGIARRSQCESLYDLIGRADQALYKAKLGGRNQVRSAE
jgi:diguanylate cyclase (GGDEF)-like protein